MDSSVISVKLDAFDGPLDLLLHLIEKNKIDIFDIPIVQITEQYLEIIAQMDRKDMDVMSDFLVMAATLLKIKSKMLLPVEVTEEGEPEDPRAELVERLLEYKTYKYASYELKDKQMDAARLLFKESTIPAEIADIKEEVNVEELLSDVTLAKLQTIFHSVMKKQVDKIDPIRSKFGRIEKEEISLSDKLLEMKEYAKAHRKFSFRRLMENQHSKIQLIVTFLAILELMKMGHVHAEQEDLFDDIHVEVITDPDTWKNLTEFADE